MICVNVVILYVGATLHTLSNFYDVPVCFVTPTSFEAVNCLFCGCQMLTFARNWMVFLVIVNLEHCHRTASDSLLSLLD